MAARIRSTVNGATPIDETSRNDLVATDVVTVTSIDAATSYNWQLSFVPQGSTAAFSGSSTAISPGSFTVDKEGSYLVKLVVDAGLASEDSQYVRLRALTTALGLKLIAGGERRDGSGVIPVDIDTEGWANEQNANLQSLEEAATLLPYHIKLAGVPNGVQSYYGWTSNDTVIKSVKAMVITPNTQGTFLFDVRELAGLSSVLATPNSDLSSLVSGTVTDFPLDPAGILSFSSGAMWQITLTSNSASFDGSEVYIEIIFEVK